MWPPVTGGSELAVLRQPATSITVTIDTGSQLGLSTDDLWGHAGQRTSGAGAAGQFSGVLDTYASDQLSNDLTSLQLVYLRLLPTVEAILRTYYRDVTVFGGAGDLGSFTSARTSNTGAAAGQDWGFFDALSQTNLPDTTNMPNFGAANRRTLIQPLSANTIYEWALTGVPLVGRALQVDNQLEAIGWGCWTAAVVTAITVDYTAIIRKRPV